jgi:protein SCO1/2
MHTILHLIAAASLLASCTRATPTPGPDARDDAPRWSVYELGSSWRDQHGAERRLSSLAGRAQVLAMIYTHCTSTCPLAIAEMKRIEAATDTSVGLVLVTLDPEHDTPAVLAEYARARELDASRWTLLGGSSDAVRELAAALGVRYRRLSPAELAHSNTLTLLDASGSVIHQQQGLGERDETIAAARALRASR